MYSQQQLENVLFLDTETVPMAASFEDLSPRMQALWEKKSRKYERGNEDKSPAELFSEYAGIHAEFGKLVCISCGYLRFKDHVPKIRLTSSYGHDEKEVLSGFIKVLHDFEKYRMTDGKPPHEINLCAHNGREFDFPWLGRRMLIHGLELPSILQVQTKKPWEVGFIDTQDLWKFGDFKAYTSLDLLCAVFDIPTPKDDINGSQVGRVYWEEKDVERIKNYCEKDVAATAQVLLRLCGLAPIPDEDFEKHV